MTESSWEITIEDDFELDEKPYICDVCELCFLTLEDLESHQSQDHPLDSEPPVAESPNGLTCEYCGKTFLKVFNLNRHMKIHENKREHKCKLCLKAFNDKSDLRRHERTHFGSKPFECEVCGGSFTKKSDLTRHRKTHSDVWELKCKFCNKRFYRKDALIAHRKIHLKNEEKDEEIYEFSCSCGLGFNDYKTFEDHVLKMGHRKLFTCKVCLNCFSNNDLLKKHERYHQERTFACTECDKKFAHSCDLVKHRRIHSNERNYLCPACGKTFIRSTHLKSHMKNIHEKLNLQNGLKKRHKKNDIKHDENVMVEIEKCNVRIKIEAEMEVIETTNQDNSFLINNVVKIKKEEEYDEDYEIDVC